MNHYQVLGLSFPSVDKGIDFQVVIKRAYHDALLKHHPDKVTSVTSPSPSVDTIKLAFSVLSDPITRQNYDQQLRLQSNGTAISGDDAHFHTGEERVDLDDLSYDEVQNIWFRPCRCGDERGFVVTEDQLGTEAAQGNGESLVACAGCSLWLRVTFSVIDEIETTVGV